MDSNHRSLSRGSRFRLRKVNCAGIDGPPKKLAGYRWFEAISLHGESSELLYGNRRSRDRPKAPDMTPMTDPGMPQQMQFELNLGDAAREDLSSKALLTGHPGHR